MDRGLAISLTAVVGGLVGLQAPVNAMLGRTVGSWQAAAVSFTIGTTLLVGIVLLAAGGFGSLGEVRHISWYYLLGGVMGAAYVTTVLVTVRTLGAGGVTAATITGQLVAAAAVDHFGLLGVERSPLDLQRLGGIALLGLGTFLVVRR